MRNYGEWDATVQIDPQDRDLTQYDDRSSAASLEGCTQETILEQGGSNGTPPRGERESRTYTMLDHPGTVGRVSIELPPRREQPSCNPWQGAFTPDAEQLLSALLSSEYGPITVDELLEAVLLIRKDRARRSEGETVYTPPKEANYGSRHFGRSAPPVKACLRLAEGADRLLPQIIVLDIARGGVFTIGRFDVSVGRKQSSFEFDKKTKAVSRHHAMIERQLDGTYLISDCGSKAGTFVNGEQLLAKVPYRLRCGDRVSFGIAGADYIWEE